MKNISELLTEAKVCRIRRVWHVTASRYRQLFCPYRFKVDRKIKLGGTAEHKLSSLFYIGMRAFFIAIKGEALV